MKTALILHGTLGSPHTNWFRWLKAQLEQQDLEVWLPALPHADQPSLHEWADYVREHCPFEINDETLIVGHSSGAILSLILAQQNPLPVGAVVAVSVFHDNSLEWEPNNQLFDVEFDWPAIRANVGELWFIHSDTDPYIPLDQARYVADHCQAELIMIPDQGHFNLEHGQHYKEFPRLMDILNDKILKIDQ
jgi:uncharacterized protein